MNNIYIIAEAAQGYEGSVEVSKLLIRSAKAASANAIKFQVVYADDLAEQGYQYYDLFKSLEMSTEDWIDIRTYAKSKEIDFIIDIFGNKSYELAKKINADGIKIHSTSFFDDELICNALSMNGDIYLSIGGIHIHEVQQLIEKYKLNELDNVNILYGFQAEPTPIDSNNLLRIPELQVKTGINSIGFMDHSDGAGQYTTNLSVLAMGLGVRIFEKHITLDPQLQMEDYTSALGVTNFANYVASLRELCKALGNSDLELNTQELAYRERAIKRVVAAKDLSAGDVISVNNTRMNRPKIQEGFFKLSDVIGKQISAPISKGEAIIKEKISS